MSSKKTAVLLVNLGTPDEPTPKAIRRFLKDFLSDRRVIEVPRFVWWWILRLFILPFRPGAVAKMYRAVWQQDSPQRIHGEQLAAKLQQQLGVTVLSAMCYGKPALEDQLTALAAKGIERLVVLPLFPQYSATTTAAAVDKISAWLATQREIPALHVIKDYWQDAGWQQNIANRISRFQSRQGQPDKLVFSFHGIPQSYADKGDQYAVRCQQTAKAIAERLGLSDDQWVYGFQSRFGRAAWVKPYTDETLKQLAKSGTAHVQVVCPGFAMDCLETLDEVSRLLHDQFVAAGGKQLDYIPALNASDAQAGWMVAKLKPFLAL